MDIRVPIDSLDLSGVSASATFGNVIGRSVPVTLSGEDYLVYGTVSLTLVGPNAVSATMGYDRYNFDMKSWRDFAIRNTGTGLGLTVNQGWSYATQFKSGRPYYIQLDGTVRIRP